MEWMMHANRPFTWIRGAEEVTDDDMAGAVNSLTYGLSLPRWMADPPPAFDSFLKQEIENRKRSLHRLEHYRSEMFGWVPTS